MEVDDYMDEKLKVEGKLYQIKTMIDEIEAAGFNVSRLKRKLASISGQAENSNLGSSQVAIKSINMDELNELVEEIKKYDPYFRILNNCNHILEYLKTTENLDGLDYYRNLVIDNLKQVKSLDYEYFEDGEQVISKVYEIAYHVIKIEIYLTGNSLILKHINQSDSYLIDRLIREDLEKIDLNSEKYQDINNKLYELRKFGGVNASFVNIELIGLIQKYIPNPLIGRIKNSIENETKSIQDNQDTISKRLEEITEIDSDTKYNRELINLSRKDIGKSLISLILTLSIISGGAYGVAKLSKKIGTARVYNETVTKYSELTDNISSYEEIIELYGGQVSYDEVAYVTLHTAWDTSGEEPTRSVIKYALRNVTLSSIYDYLVYDLSNAPVEDKKIIQDNYDIDKDKYQESYREVELHHYEDTGEKIPGGVGSIIGGEVIYTFLVLMLIVLIASEGKILVVDDIQDIVDEIEDIIDSKKESHIKIKLLKKKLKELIDIINQNEELKKEIDAKIKKYGRLISESDELLSLLESNDYSTIKESVKTLSKKNMIIKKIK